MVTGGYRWSLLTHFLVYDFKATATHRSTVGNHHLRSIYRRRCTGTILLKKRSSRITRCQVNMGTPEIGHPGYPNGSGVPINMGTGVFIFMIKMGILPQK